ncbi:GIY-YIG nuclease family protein [Alkalinema pantanalense CENA528]|uniref:GIY-YIG nuclease family protein n=1 Tax=Alkalinema pantanalense TaxID=1620705 RepID=UPI003D6F0866
MPKYRTSQNSDHSSLPSPIAQSTPTPPQIEQPSLFSAKELAGTYLTQRSQTLEMDATALTDWKQRILEYQTAVEIIPAIAQGSLFDFGLSTPPSQTTDPDRLNPFELPQQNTQFWRWKAEDLGVSALYFVFDYTLPILLYVGETVKSNQRWKGEHDCKRYLLHYQQAHYNNNLPTQLGIAFWQDAPQQARSRQKMESTLIYKWRSPFNKENWAFWGTPFVEHK